MRVLSRADFLKMPAGTMYAKGEPWAFDGIHVRGDTMPNGNDWDCAQLAWIDSDDSGQAVDRLDDMLENGASYPMDASYGRDGCFNEADLFLVFERADLIQLGKIVDQAILVAE